jgi:hypothetical protein
MSGDSASKGRLSMKLNIERYDIDRYDYASYKTLARAKAALEDCYATGEVSDGEFPTIERRGGRVRGSQYYYVLTLVCRNGSGQ